MSRKEEFKQLISKHLKEKLEYLKEKYGEDSKEYLAIYNQYVYNVAEESSLYEVNNKHYEADCSAGLVQNLERLYQRHGCVEISWTCTSNCRYCLRSNYSEHNLLSDENLIAIAEYCRDQNFEELLITGGDPFCNVPALSKLLGYLYEIAPNVQIYRIATRMITQSPRTIPEKVFSILSRYNNLRRVEIATQINSHVEFDDDVDAVIKKIQSLGILIYSQNVFLKGVNDTPEQLIELYHAMRMRGIEAHYLFHAVPMKGTHHLRPSISKMLYCYEELVNSGHVTGRSKPILAIMSQIGKITLTPDNVLGYDEVTRTIGLKSRYKYDDRIKYNPSWKLPDSAYVDKDGYLCINYLDGED